MKLTDILEVMNWAEEEMEKGVVFEKKQCDYEFVTPKSKKDKVTTKKRK